jgi:hypothetical protein
MMRDDMDYAMAEINPLFFARIPRLYINMIVSLLLGLFE